MGMFANLMSKIFGHASKDTTTTATSTPPTAASAVTETSAAAPAPVAAAAVPPPVVDVAAILDGLAAKSPEKLEWKTSIVDLMKLVGMDSSLAARKELATDLKYSGDQSDSATMNIWLHKEVLIKLADNGGKVPKKLLG